MVGIGQITCCCLGILVKNLIKAASKNISTFELSVDSSCVLFSTKEVVGRRHLPSYAIKIK
jgi:hypothetical protein